jgi:hypothetical protein
MSEYQYYEFLALDRPLTYGEQELLRGISSRAQITATSFSNHYEYGDLKASPLEMVKKWFDVHVYTGFWMTRTLMIRLPRHLFDVEAAKPYLSKWTFKIEKAGDNVVLVFQADELELDMDDDGSGWIGRLAPLRAALMEGDNRCLYIAWLRGVQNGTVEDEDLEPPRPPGLYRLDGPLRAFADFLDIDPDLLHAATSLDDGSEPDPMTPEALESFIDTLPSSEKTALLARVVQGEASLVSGELRRRFRSALPASPATASSARRSVADLRREAESRATERKRLKAERDARERERQEREAAEARSRRLDALSRRGDSAWREVEQLIEERNAPGYDRAVTLLQDLGALAEKNGTSAAFGKRIAELRSRHARKGSLIKRFDEAGLK